MGCGASRNDIVTPSDASSKPALKKKNDTINSETANLRLETKQVPGNDFHESNTANGTESLNDTDTSPPYTRIANMNSIDENPSKLRRPDPVSFEVPVEEQGSAEAESLIKRHPPRRLRKAVEEQQKETYPALTQQLLMQKTELANERRAQALNKRIASARQKSARIVNNVVDLPQTETF